MFGSLSSSPYSMNKEVQIVNLCMLKWLWPPIHSQEYGWYSQFHKALWLNMFSLDVNEAKINYSTALFLL